MQPEVTYQPFTLLHNNFIIIIIIMAIVYDYKIQIIRATPSHVGNE